MLWHLEPAIYGGSGIDTAASCYVLLLARFYSALRSSHHPRLSEKMAHQRYEQISDQITVGTCSGTLNPSCTAVWGSMRPIVSYSALIKALEATELKIQTDRPNTSVLYSISQFLSVVMSSPSSYELIRAWPSNSEHFPTHSEHFRETWLEKHNKTPFRRKKLYSITDRPGVHSVQDPLLLEL